MALTIHGLTQLWYRRLCFTGAPQVVEDCYNILKEYGFRFVRRGPIYVKGKGELLTFFMKGKDKPVTKTTSLPHQIPDKSWEDWGREGLWHFSSLFWAFSNFINIHNGKRTKKETDWYLMFFYKHIPLMTFSLFHVYSVKLLVIDQIIMSQNVWISVDCGFSSSLCCSQCFIVWQNYDLKKWFND